MARSSSSDRSSATRRRFLAGTGTAGVLGLTGSVGATDAEASVRRDGVASPDDVDDLPLIDAHTHLIPAETLDRDPLSADELVAWMDDNGVDRAVVLALDSPESYPVQAPSWWVLEEVEAHPDRLLPFCTVDPRTLVYEEDFGAVTDLLEEYVDRGARGFGELKAGLPIDDDRLEALYELCADHGLPIFFHTDEKAMMDEVGLPRLEDVVASYPEVDFLAHAHAWWVHISADVDSDDRGAYPSGPVEPGGRVPELLSEYDNLYGDLSGLSGWNALTRDEEYAQSFLEDHHEQLVFGTDYLSPDQEIPHFDLFERFDLDLEAWADIRYRNLEGVLR
ncbi:amidohydrolase family protein [Natronobacterium texcoconense]|uniref:Amidohydrolase n=1 Tax=Natronobacterium texcoconense TaxID=1095778 RepID=A0A1H1GZ23_NATTX|nr:amidohydrolase family protein [Natronobacterium texcoconense]SDR18410.1 Amidohydrolase [Natronobacterium texcoconense]